MAAAETAIGDMIAGDTVVGSGGASAVVVGGAVSDTGPAAAAATGAAAATATAGATATIPVDRAVAPTAAAETPGAWLMCSRSSKTYSATAACCWNWSQPTCAMFSRRTMRSLTGG